jgi:hypothetical protein
MLPLAAIFRLGTCNVPALASTYSRGIFDISRNFFPNAFSTNWDSFLEKVDFNKFGAP